MNFNDVAEVEEPSGQELTDHAHSAGISTSVFFPSVYQCIQGHNGRVSLSFHRNQPMPTLGINPNTDIDTSIWSTKWIQIV